MELGDGSLVLLQDGKGNRLFLSDADYGVTLPDEQDLEPLLAANNLESVRQCVCNHLSTRWPLLACFHDPDALGEVDSICLRGRTFSGWRLRIPLARSRGRLYVERGSLMLQPHYIIKTSNDVEQEQDDAEVLTLFLGLRSLLRSVEAYAINHPTPINVKRKRIASAP